MLTIVSTNLTVHSSTSMAFNLFFSLLKMKLPWNWWDSYNKFDITICFHSGIIFTSELDLIFSMLMWPFSDGPNDVGLTSGMGWHRNHVEMTSLWGLDTCRPSTRLCSHCNQPPTFLRVLHSHEWDEEIAQLVRARGIRHWGQEYESQSLL